APSRRRRAAPTRQHSRAREEASRLATRCRSWLRVRRTPRFPTVQSLLWRCGFRTMAYCFGDSFDLYAASADAAPSNSYWDLVAAASSYGLTTSGGRFGGGYITNSQTTGYLGRTSGQNDSVHHIVCAFRQSNTALSGTNIGIWLQLVDGATNQC